MQSDVILSHIAHEAMIERGFIPDFPNDVVIELASIQNPAPPHKPFRDLRALHWVSIDNDDSRDLDQLTYAEDMRVFIAIADVDVIVKKGLPIDTRAAHNTTTVYTPTAIFPMLPLKISNDLTSLNLNADRCAIVVEIDVAENGKFQRRDIYPALVRNHAKLAYSHVARCLDHASCGQLQKQLTLQDRMAQKIKGFRATQGALEFGITELEPIVVNGIAVGLQEKERNRAHQLIENFMIAANVCVTEFLDQNKLPTLRRVVKQPKRWNRIVALAKSLGEDLPPRSNALSLREFLLKQKQKSPLAFPDLSLAIIKLIGRGEYVLGTSKLKDLGHFNLAEFEYAHTTAPNRRYPDVIMQRLLKSFLYQEKLPYTKKELSKLALHCTKKEADAEKVQRRLVKCAAAMVLTKEKGREYRALITGKTSRGTWVRLMEYPIEGKLIEGAAQLDVGDYLKVKLIHADIMKGHLDFKQI